MPEVSHVYAGAVRSVEGGRGGVFRQAAGEERWEALTEGLPDETEVHAITVHPDDPDFSTGDNGESWAESRLPEGAGDYYAIACG
jgi:hypothetical protein